MNKEQVKKYQIGWNNQLDIGEKKQQRIFSQYLRKQYFIGVDRFLISRQIENTDDLFAINDFIDFFKNLYVDIGLRMANWYSNNHKKYLTKNFHDDQLDLWQQKFSFIGETIAAQRVVSVSGNRKKELIKVLGRFMSLPDFQVMNEVPAGRLLRKKFRQLSVSNAKRIIRTESVNAGNFATNQSAIDIFGAQNLKKQWIASLDDRTRNAHAQVNGQVVNMNEKFVVMGELLAHPGDSAGSAGNVINCRCTNAPVPI